MRTMVQHCGHRMRGVRDARMWLIGRGIVIGLCALACFVALSLYAERVAAAGYTVNVPTDTGIGLGAIGDLRYAINQVNNSTDPGNTITITATGTITLTSALPGLSKNVAITGPGAAMLTVQAAAMPKTATYGVFTVTPSVTASITNLTIANGNSFTDLPGSGIGNAGVLTVTNSTFSGNSATSGGGITNADTLTVTNSTLSGNSTTNSGSGGGIFNIGTLTVTNSTLSGNSSAVNYGGGINILVGTVNLTNTIVAGNIVSDINGTVVSHGHNLIGTTSGTTGIMNGTKGDIVSPTPRLGPLADNGGTTPLPDGTHVTTQAITSSSPAFHAGDPNVCIAPFPTGANSQDERGATFPRSTTACSIGAFEPQSATTTITLSPTALPNGTVGVAYNQTISASGGSGTGFTFAITAGTLPSGLTLSSSGLLSGTPTAAGLFTFTVTATDSARNMGSQQYTLTITATAPPTLKSIAITGPGGTPPPTTIKVGQMVQITATGTYSDGSTANITSQVVWSSTTPTIAKVDTTGKVTGESPGTATISATLNGVTQTFTVAVGAPTPIGITVQPAPQARPSSASSSSPGIAPAPAPGSR